MIQFSTIILQFAKQGEKTGWSYISVPMKIAQQLKPGNKQSFRVKGSLDDHPVSSMALMPMGDGSFIMALNGTIRRQLKKQKGDQLQVRLEVDEAVVKPPAELMECLADEKKALANFNNLSKSQRNYFGNWIRSAKTEATQAKRIVQAIAALEKGFDFGQMIRALKAKKQDDPW